MKQFPSNNGCTLPKSSIHQLYTLLIALYIALVISNSVYAQNNYPSPIDSSINDFANLLTTEDAGAIRILLGELQQNGSITAVVATIHSFKDYSTSDETFEAFATNLFNTWEIGDKAQNRGVLLLVAVTDRKVRIEVGAGYGSSVDAQMQEVINEHILPSFRRNEYSRGIHRGVRAIVGELTGTWPPDRSRPTAAQTATISEMVATPTAINLSPGPQLHWGIVGSIFGVVIAIGAAIFGLLYLTQDRCYNCNTPMICLDEVTGETYLNAGQKVERLLGSVNYTVWKCPTCDEHTVYSKQHWFTTFKSCPKCNYQTVEMKTQQLVEPTYTTPGKKQITRTCRHCQFRDQAVITLPMRTRTEHSNGSFHETNSLSTSIQASDTSYSSSSSNSSSSNSSDGGHSSGGGASGNW